MSLKILGGTWKGRLLKSSAYIATRPTQGILRAAVFNMCQDRIAGSRFLDLFAGSGAMGLEALSRGASFATLVECDRQAVRCIRENIERLNVSEHCELLAMDVLKALKQLGQRETPYHLIYIDPPYREAPILVPKILAELVERGLVSPGAIVLIETPKEMKLEPFPFRWVDSRRFGIAQLHRLSYEGNR